jgi:hypothetical protein
MQGWERLPTCEQASAEPLKGEHVVVTVVRLIGMVMLGTSIGMSFVFIRWYFGIDKL